jgi:hypothetical protein
MSIAMILKLLPRHTKQVPSGRSRYLAANDYTIPGDEDFLDLELHVGDGFGKASGHFDRGITAPAFAGQIAPARLVVRGEDLFLEQRLEDEDRQHGARSRDIRCQIRTPAPSGADGTAAREARHGASDATQRFQDAGWFLGGFVG